MYAAFVSLVGPASADQRPEHWLRSLVVEQADGKTLEHVHIAIGFERIEITMFLRSPSQAEADLAAYRIGAKVCRYLPGWYPDT